MCLNTLPAWPFEPCFWPPATANFRFTWRSTTTCENTVRARHMDNDNSHAYDGLRRVLKLHRTFPFGVGHLCFPALFSRSCPLSDGNCAQRVRCISCNFSKLP